ncbi:MAG: HipA N-terminal domain-containing protein [Bacteroidota bacterium]|nr:HipA N-terminal domain-containing protein [Bacteroidota bacterium]
MNSRHLMRRAKVFVKGIEAGVLEERVRGTEYIFRYLDTYQGEPVSLTMPIEHRYIRFDCFPPFYDGLLNVGVMLVGLLRQRKIDKNDFFSQLVAVGQDLVGAVTVEEIL